MILRLRIADFGKFKDQTFELGPVTVVHGPNEAGKTTLFDALHHALCKPSETRQNGKRHKARYGAGRKAEVDLSGPFEIEEDEFYNLSAIRAGDLDLEMGKGSPWVDRLKSRLFHGGLDPAALAAEFARRSSDNRTLTHMRELEALKAKEAKASAELADRLRDRESLLLKEKALVAEEARLGDMRGALTRNAGERNEVAAQLAFEEKIEKRRKLDAALARLDESEALARDLRELEAFKEDRRSEWEALAQASRNSREKHQAARVRLEAVAEQVTKARANLRRQEEVEPSRRDLSTLAKTCASELRTLLSGPNGSGPLPWVAGLVCVLLGVLSAGFIGVLVWQVACLALGLGTGGAAALILRARAHRGALEKRTGAIDALKDRFLVGESGLRGRSSDPEGGRSAVADLTTAEGLLEAWDRMAGDGEAASRQSAQLRLDLSGLEEEATVREAAVKKAHAEVEASIQSEKEWLTRQGVATSGEYFQKVGRHSQLQSTLSRQSQGENAPANPVEERREISRQIKDLEDEGIPRQGLDSAALQRLRRKAQDLDRARVDLERGERGLLEDNARQSGAVRGTLGKLAADIVRTEEVLLQVKAQVEDKELDRRAAAIAHGVFKGIGDGADLLLAGLARELQAMLDPILPGGRAVTLLGLDQKQITVQDAAGGTRALENLSSGTRDAVVLAAKLALAVKTREGAGLLVLDDPFHAMDRDREEKALRMIQDFHLRHGWQIILLTKDAHLRDGMLRRFPDCRTVEL